MAFERVKVEWVIARFLKERGAYSLEEIRNTRRERNRDVIDYSLTCHRCRRKHVNKCMVC